MVNKENAVKLREMGLSYRAIADELGCSEAWCKINLKHVVKNTKEVEAVARCVEKALSKDGITSSEIRQEIYKIHFFEDTDNGRQVEEDALKRFKRKILSVDGAVIRPYWMKPSSSIKIFQRVLSIVNTMDDRLNDELNDLREEFDLDSTYINSLSFIISKLTYAGSLDSHESLSSRLSQLEKVSTELHKRNKDATNKEVQRKTEKLSGFDDCNDYIL